MTLTFISNIGEVLVHNIFLGLVFLAFDGSLVQEMCAAGFFPDFFFIQIYSVMILYYL